MTPEITDPFQLWETNKNLPNRTAQHRLYKTCKRFKDDLEFGIRTNHNLFKTIETRLPEGGTLTHREPDASLMHLQFSRLCEWFLSELSEIWIDHISRSGLNGAAGIEAFQEQFERFSRQALNHVWGWGFNELKLGTADEHEWNNLVECVRADKLRELAELWPRKHGESNPLPFISGNRLAELRLLQSADFDFRKLIRICEELNAVYSQECYISAVFLIRALLDHVPPIFGKTTFSEVANNHGGQSFTALMSQFNTAARKIADNHLHEQIRKRETLPTQQQVHFGPQLDFLLGEIVRISA